MTTNTKQMTLPKIELYLMSREDLMGILRQYGLEDNLALQEGSLRLRVSGDIVDPEEWRQETLTELNSRDIDNRCDIEDILSLACYDGYLAEGKYLLENYW